MSASGPNHGDKGFQEPPPPKGWLKQIDASSGHPFWVDTEASPPRSIWVHPFEDDQYKREHPDMVQARDFNPPSEPPPEYRRRSYESGQGSSRAPPGPRDSHSQPPTPTHEKRGFFGKLKDKAIGTKEEREAHKKQQEEMRRQMMAQREQAMRQMMEQARSRNQYSQPGFAPGQYVQHNPQVMYGPPGGNPYAGGGYYGGRGGFGGGGFGGGGFGGRGGGMGMGMPLLGGLAGGMLLGDMIGDAGDGGFGGDGGGDFGGGDMGGGDF